MLEGMVCWRIWCVGGHGVLEDMVCWRTWRVGGHGVLEGMVCWRAWCVGGYGVLEGMVCWRACMVCWRAWCVGGHGMLEDMVCWRHSQTSPSSYLEDGAFFGFCRHSSYSVWLSKGVRYTHAQMGWNHTQKAHMYPYTTHPHTHTDTTHTQTHKHKHKHKHKHTHTHHATTHVSRLTGPHLMPTDPPKGICQATVVAALTRVSWWLSPLSCTRSDCSTFGL